jgi:3-isopropylmalate dehydratase small subunit
MILQGKVWKFGDDVDTDQIIPARYLNSSDPAELAKYAMEDARAGFAEVVGQGDIIVAGKNFGCGSSREHAPICIKAAGITGVIAPSFARIFYRNAINIGLPIFESKEASEAIEEGHEVRLNATSGVIEDLTTGEKFQAVPFPDFMQELIAAGGLMNYIKKNKMDK